MNKRLTCLCTPNALCSHCQDVIVLGMIAGRLFTAGAQDRGNQVIDVAGFMDNELRASYKERLEREKQKALFT